MFWGLIMEPHKRYSQTVKKSFHISHAAMDIATGDIEPCQLMVVVNGQNFLICTLQKHKAIQTPLDLYFREGETISFITNGKSHIHLTGYLAVDFDEDLEEEEEEEEGNEVEETAAVEPSKKSKRKLEASPETSISKKQKKEKEKQKKNDTKNTTDESSDDSDDSSLGGKLEAILDSSDELDDTYEPEELPDEQDDESDSEDDEEQEEEEEEEQSTPEVTPSKNKNKNKNKSPEQNGLSDKKKNKEKENDSKPKEESATGEKKKITGNVSIEDLKVGQGNVAKPGKMIQVYYQLRLQSNNKKIDACSSGPGFKFRLGKNEVIRGWDVGVAGMKVGGKRRIVCPPGMAYGNKGSPPLIPPNSTLVFEVELKSVS